MTHEPSRKTLPHAPLHSAGCPRCGFRQVESFKYCPNCAYRLVPEITPHAAAAGGKTPLGQRLVALGGYFALTSLLLLVVLAGVQLFIEGEPSSSDALQALVVPRDPQAIPLTEAALVHVASGRALFGPYGLARRDEEAEQRREEALRRALAALGEERLEEARGALEEALDSGGVRYTNITPVIVDDPFEMGRYEVTNDQYFEFLAGRAAKSGRPTPEALYPGTWTRHSGRPDVTRIYDHGRGNHPVRDVSFAAALEFCAWFWEERLGADPDRVVDLPTAAEFVLAARGDRASYNFPWGRDFDEPEARAVLSGDPQPVNDAESVGEYDGFFALVGNVAEWVHGRAAAGWSFKKSEVLKTWYYRSEWRTPFSTDGFEYIEGGRPREDIGFRIVVRHTPAVPEFEAVGAGPSRHADRENPLMFPSFDEEPERITFERRSYVVERDFELARTETTNRQYLAFLAERGRRPDVATLSKLLPKTWDRLHPHADADALLEKYGSVPRIPPDELAAMRVLSEIYPGPWGDPRKIPLLYPAGAGNRPVQGVGIEQVEAYHAWLSERLGRTCRIPTVAEYLRAGRGDGVQPYPWGDDPLRRELICARETDNQRRAVSLLGRLGTDRYRIVGLVGNLPEYVRDSVGKRLLLAGGCFEFPARACTLDSYFDAAWEYAEWMDAEGRIGSLSSLGYYHGFRTLAERP